MFKAGLSTSSPIQSMLLIGEAMGSRGHLLISLTRFARLPGICGGKLHLSHCELSLDGKRRAKCVGILGLHFVPSGRAHIVSCKLSLQYNPGSGYPLSVPSQAWLPTPPPAGISLELGVTF